LTQGEDLPRLSRDPRLSGAGNDIAKRLRVMIELLTRLEGWLRHDGHAVLTPQDRTVLAPRFARLAQDAATVAALARDFEAAA
jgi:hypothetical protein